MMIGGLGCFCNVKGLENVGFQAEKIWWTMPNRGGDFNRILAIATYTRTSVNHDARKDTSQTSSVQSFCMMDAISQFLVFHLDGSRYGIILSQVVRAVHAVEITPLPQAPEIVLGMIDVHGKIVPVF